MGLQSPDTCRIFSAADVAAWQITPLRPAVVKLDGTWGGTGVKIVTSADEAVSSIRALLKPQWPGTAWKRYLINGDPLALWARKSASRPVVSLQRFIPGRPANAMLACWQGELLGLVTTEVIASQGPTGSATIVRLIDHPEIAEAARRVTARLRLSGFHGLDFILEEATGSAFLIELNPRCTQLGHLILPAQGDLVGILCRGLGLRTAPLPEPAIEGDLVGFFPQAAAWNPDSPYLKLVQHDIPWSEPALIHELLRSSWSDRRLVMRLYRLLRGLNPERVPELGQVDLGLMLRPRERATRQAPLRWLSKRNRRQAVKFARPEEGSRPDHVVEG
ncbi:MAG TPA: ATP-grasp domain-containing protein [Candidatus Binataceae bacterium]|nr:ATP-grasp domain-containing protein [Candidatus Binataceae bacterium]